jgi:hypothetical protein
LVITAIGFEPEAASFVIAVCRLMSRRRRQKLTDPYLIGLVEQWRATRDAGGTMFDLADDRGIS